MAASTPSSLARYRPAVLVLTGAAAAYTAYLIYSSLQQPPADSLHRSNAVRRSPRQPGPLSRIARGVQHNSLPLGDFDFFGTAVVLDAQNLVTADELRQIAHSVDPSADARMVEDGITQLYNTLFDRFLADMFPATPLSSVERDVVCQWIGPRVPDEAALASAIRRHNRAFSPGDDAQLIVAGAVDTADDIESVAPTERSWRSDEDTEDDGLDAEGQTLQRTLYHIAEHHARNLGVVHRGITCNGCDAKPIRGVRWRCANCADFDLCADCEATNSHYKTHIFYKIRVPAPYLGMPKQEPVYPGKPHVMTPSINSSIKKRLVSETKMEAEEIEALWDQFTCLAGTEWQSDPNGIGWALDRRAFNHAFVPRYASFISAPNLLYDRVFAFYDSDHNGLIGFEEWIKGLNGMHSRDQRIKLGIVFAGYDVNGDGYISRKDVLRIFRAYYAMEKEATRNYLAEASEELSVRGALETIHSSQPLGSAFVEGRIPTRFTPNPYLNRKPSEERLVHPPVISDDREDTEDREAIFHEINLVNQSRQNQVPHIDDTAHRERWARRHFYLDEEEGLTRPEGFRDPPSTLEHDEQAQEDTNSPPTADAERPRGSRSSSRVRFQDDVEDIETRSNASTSSRMVGERWGGYEIPELEKDVGKEVLYQITQQALNELLNPLFQEKEDNAMDAFATRSERREYAAQIDSITEEFNAEKHLNRTLVKMGTFHYCKDVATALKDHPLMKNALEALKKSDWSSSEAENRIAVLFSRAEKAVLRTAAEEIDDDWTPDAMTLWNAKLCRVQFQREFVGGVLDAAKEVNWIPHLSTEAWPRRSPDSNKKSPILESLRAQYRDPTMPHFRPNSLADMQEGIEVVTVEQTLHGDPTMPQFRPNSEAMVEDALETESSEPPLLYRPFFVLPHHHTRNIPHDDDQAQERNPPSPPQGDIEIIDTQDTPTDSPQPLRPSVPTYESNNDPGYLQLSIESAAAPGAHSLCVELTARFHQNNQDAIPQLLARRLRREILKDARSPLRMGLLASLQVVDREISERKGSGLLDFEEFREGVSVGQMRFLESWMDWVSY
ncbi:hypothetical protein BDV95DRAFT_501504 [Massariosphaeria phaeospora]|uniref:EF hand domain-containing protein n=1 Tax=Massariosphaeria phaeospora TaxID=100035 RepID=A0A7C8M3U6_9PLEO|nr:hypothetical protein BDV95DRAFT_501504 [Massariosphaeria phaeospora]